MTNADWTAEPNIHRIERGSVWTMVLGGFLLISLTTGLLLFYFISTGSTDKPGFHLNTTQIVTAAGILGLVVIFGLYAFQKQRSLTGIRNELIQQQMQEESLRSRLSELSVLFDVSGEANLQLELDPLLELITRRVLTCLEADRSSIFLIDEETGEMFCRAVSGSNSELVKDARIAKGQGIAGWVSENNEPLVLNDDETVRKFASEVKPGRGISTALCVPMATGGVVSGVMSLSRIEGTRPFTAADARMVTIFAEHAASAITRIRQYEALDQKAELLQEANQTLARLNRSKQVFLATVNHELKGPLTIILAYAEFLARNEASLDVARRQSFAKILHEQAERLKGITGQILNIARLEDLNVQLDRKPSSLNQLITKVAQELEDEAAARAVGIKMHFDSSAPTLHIDPDLFLQALRMLLSNTIGAAESNSTVHVMTRTEPGLFGFEVRADGVKMSESDAKKVFTLFDGTEPREQTLVDGLGLGLYLLRRVTELHGGKVKAKRQPDGGSTFSIVLPISDANTTAKSEVNGDSQVEKTPSPSTIRTQQAHTT